MDRDFLESQTKTNKKSERKKYALFALLNLFWQAAISKGERTEDRNSTEALTIAAKKRRKRCAYSHFVD